MEIIVNSPEWNPLGERPYSKRFPHWLAPCVSWSSLSHSEREVLLKFLNSVVGKVCSWSQYGVFTWSLTDMARELGVSIVSETLAESLAGLPSSPGYLELIEIIIDDWQGVDRIMNHERPEELAKVIETLAKKRDEIRDNLREEPYLNATVDVSKGRFDIPITEWESEAKAPQKPSERAQ